MSQEELYAEYRRASAFCLPCRILDNGDLARRISGEARATVARELDGERLAGTLQTLFREVIA